MPARSAAYPKVAIVCHSHPSVSKGGAETAAYALFRGLREWGVDAIFIAACNEADRGRLALASAQEHAVFYDPTEYEYLYHLAPLRVERSLTELLAAERVDVVNFHHFLHFGVNTLRAVRAMPEVKVFLTLHEYLAICHHHGQMVTHPAHLLCHRASLEACTACYPELLRTQFAVRKSGLLSVLATLDGHVSPSAFLATRYVDWGLPQERMHVIENGLADGAPPTGPSLRGSDTVWTFGYFGQINPFKGVDVILDAATQLAAEPKRAKSIRIRIHGNLVGQSAEFITRFTTAARDNPLLSYSGPYESASVYQRMRECDYLIVPSKWWENSPVVIQEAFAAQVPVLCTGIGGLAEKVLDGVSGLHFARNDPHDLVRVMKLAADSTMAERLRSGIPAVASAGEIARRYLRVYGGAMPEHGAHAAA